jgi:hypothetical protein
MKTYPSIPKDIPYGQPIYAFDKLDGSNIRVEWSKKKGFHKFGTRKRLLGSDEDILGKAYTLIEDFDRLSNIFTKQRWQDVTLFFELHGDNSFAGWHDPSDDHELTLLDVSVYKKGMLPPKEFVKLFEDKVRTAPLLYAGNASHPFVEDVQNGTLEGMTYEGVVCKYLLKNVHKMFKVKNQKWIDRLKDKCGDDVKLFEQLV